MTTSNKRPVGGASMTFAVLVDDNFHYMDTSARYTLGDYETYEAAVAACKAIVDESLAENYVKGMRADDLYQRYMTFGEDPWVAPTPEGEHFSAWDYAKQQCTERAGPLTNPGKSVSDWPLDLSGDNLLLALEIVQARFKDSIPPEIPMPVQPQDEDGPSSRDCIQAVRFDMTPDEVHELVRKRGPLPEALIHRIDRVLPVIRGLRSCMRKDESTSVRDAWIDGISVYLFPERVVAWLEWIAETLVSFSRFEVETWEQFAEAYELLESRSMMSEADTIREVNPQALTEFQVTYLLALGKLENDPVKSTEQKQTSTPKPESSVNSILSDTALKVHQALTSRGMLEIAADETAKMLARKKVNDALGAAWCRKNHPDLVHLLEEDRERSKEPETTLPQYSAHRYSATGQMFFASRGGTGFAPKDVFGPLDEAMTPDDWNEKNGVTKADAAAMLAGTMIGWDGPLAQASNYDADGHLIDETFKNCSDAQILQARLECHSKTFLDWPHDLSGDNLLKALNIVEERFKAYRQPQEVDSRIHPPLEKPHPLEGVRVVRVDISESELVRLRAERGPLSDALVRRIERVMPVFKDLYTPVFKGGSASLRDEWIEGFNLDLHPEWEVAYWEWLAESLLIFSRSEVLTFEQFKEAYNLLMSAYNKGKVAAMKEANLQLFTADQVEYLLSGCSRVGDQGKPPGREGVRKFQD